MEYQFAVYEIAEAVKELGFDEKCLRGYDKNRMLFYSQQNNGHFLNYSKGLNINAPLNQQVISYLKINHKILVAEFWDGWGMAKEGDDFVVYSNMNEAILKAIEVITKK